MLSPSLLRQVCVRTFAKERWGFKNRVSIPSSSGLCSYTTKVLVGDISLVSIPSSSGLCSYKSQRAMWLFVTVSIPSSSGLCSYVLGEDYEIDNRSQSLLRQVCVRTAATASPVRASGLNPFFVRSVFVPSGVKNSFPEKRVTRDRKSVV